MTDPLNNPEYSKAAPSSNLAHDCATAIQTNTDVANKRFSPEPASSENPPPESSKTQWHNQNCAAKVSSWAPSRYVVDPAVCIRILAGGLITGVAFNMLFGNPDGLGANLFLGMLVFYSGYFMMERLRPIPHWRNVCAVIALIYGSAVAVRASDILSIVNVVAAIAFTALACTAGSARATKSTLSCLIDLFQLARNALFGFIMLATEIPWRLLTPRQKSVGIAARMAFGGLIAIPFMVVFGLLFSMAEMRFGEMFRNTFTLLVDTVLNRLWLTVIVTFCSLGLLRNAFLNKSDSGDDYTVLGSRCFIGTVESATVLCLLNVMFLLFVITQIPYLFGGQNQVNKTAHLAWSEYARSGFFELAWVAALLIPTLMLFMNATRLQTPTHRKTIQGLCLGLTALAGVVIASALQRMILYTQNFGYTELRLYVSCFIVMLAVILVMQNALNVFNRNRHFLPAALCVCVVFSIGIQVPNLQGFIASDIIRRHLSGRSGDLVYLKNLSTDAVPAIIRSRLPGPEKRATVQAILQRGAAGHETFHWLSQPYSEKMALQAAGHI